MSGEERRVAVASLEEKIALEFLREDLRRTDIAKKAAKQAASSTATPTIAERAQATAKRAAKLIAEGVPTATAKLMCEGELAVELYKGMSADETLELLEARLILATRLPKSKEHPRRAAIASLEAVLGFVTAKFDWEAGKPIADVLSSLVNLDRNIVDDIATPRKKRGATPLSVQEVDIAAMAVEAAQRYKALEKCTVLEARKKIASVLDKAGFRQGSGASIEAGTIKNWFDTIDKHSVARVHYRGIYAAYEGPSELITKLSRATKKLKMY
ncbi:hypothetical protein LMIY3S_04512 [Labrys miyagiensis]